MFKKIIYILFLQLFLASCADEHNLPVSYEKKEIYEGSRLIVGDGGSPDSTFSYLIKPLWANEADVIKTWKGPDENSSLGITLNNAFIYDGISYRDKLVITWKTNNEYMASLISPELEIINSIQITSFEVLNRANPSIEGSFDNHILIKFDKDVYALSINDSKLSLRLAGREIESVHLTGIEEIPLALITSGISGYQIDFLDKNFEKKFGHTTSFSDSIFVLSLADQIITTKGSPETASTLIESVNKNKSSVWIDAPIDRIARGIQKGTLIYLETYDGYYSLKSIMYGNEHEPVFSAEIPRNYIEPLKLLAKDDLIYIIFRNGMMTYDAAGRMISSVHINFGEILAGNINICPIADILVITSDNASIVLKREPNTLWFLNSIISSFKEYLIPIILAAALLIFIQLYRHKSRVFNEITALPSSGIILQLDNYGRLKWANTAGKEFLGVSSNIPLNRQFSYYCRQERTEPILDFAEQAMIKKESTSKKISVIDGRDTKEWLCRIKILLNPAGAYRGFILTAIDLTEQLERKRLSNWAQLAHDMQTNLTTIRLNAEQLDVDDDNGLRRSKIIHQARVLMQRVRDIVTVGRDEKIDKGEHSAGEICAMVLSEFDETVFPGVKFLNSSEDFMLACDRPKLIRALRNAVENGIKSMPARKGVIELKCRRDTRNAYFTVKDSGKGMDEDTKKKILKPYFTTAGDKGGSGIGTMIMQHVAELHGGRLMIDSKKGSGTEVTFEIPLRAKKNK
ncbi:MAG: sensor histidine kinase [Candidatus Kapaibacterium sp.]